MSLPAGTDLRRVGANSLIGSAWTLVSRVSGLGRLVVVAAVLGPTVFGDLYQQSNELPNLTFELLTGSLFLSLVVPALVRHFDRGSRQVGIRLASGFMTLSAVAALSVAVVGMAGGPLIIGLLSAGVPDDAARTDSGAAWLLLSLLLLQAPLYLVAGMAAAVQNAQGRFALAAAAPAVENIGIIVVLGIYAAVFGRGVSDGQGMAEVALLGVGTTTAVLLHAAVQWFGARRCGVPLRPVNGWRDPEVRELLRLAVPSVVNAALNVARHFCVLVVAAAVPGGVIAFSLAFAFYNLPVALGAKPVAQAALPELSRAYHRGDFADYSRTFDSSLGLVLFVVMPAAMGYALLSGPVAAAVGFGEMATPHAQDLVRYALLGISFGVVGGAVLWFATQASYAQRNGRRPLAAVALRAGLSVSGMLVSLALLDGAPLLLAIGISVTVADLVAGSLLCWWVRRSVGERVPGLGRAVTRTALSTLAMAPAVLAVPLLTGSVSGRAGDLLTVLLAAAAGAVVYVAVQQRLRSPEVAGLRSLVRRRSAR